MTFVSIAFQNIAFKPLKQAIGCLHKGCDQIIHVISNHDGVLSSTELPILMSFTAKNKSAKKTLNSRGPSIEPWYWIDIFDIFNKTSLTGERKAHDTEYSVYGQKMYLCSMN